MAAEDLWDCLAPDAVRGSSGQWTASLGGLPISRGGCATEAEALDALRSAHRKAMGDGVYRERAADIALLPKPVQRTAESAGSGEVMWHVSAVAGAVSALAGAGGVVLGLDVRDYAADGSFVEIAWSSYDPADGEDADAAREAAMEALTSRHLPGEWAVVTWR